MVTLHNLSPEPATVRLPGDLADRAGDGGLRQLLAGSGSPDGAAGEAGGVRADADIPLAGYGYRWLRLPEDGALG